MPKRTNEFQTMIYQTYTHLAEPTDTVTESAMLKERGNGTDREVDVLVEHPVVGTDLRIAVECRDRKDKDDIEWIDGLLGKYKDLDVQKVIAVSRSGFSQAALKKARDNRIDPLTLEHVTDQTWPSGLFCPGLGGWSRTDHPLKIRVITEPPYLSQVQINQSIFREDGTRLCSLGDLGWVIYYQFRDAITESIQARFLEFFPKADDLRANALTAVIDFPITFSAFLDHESQKYRLISVTLFVRCDFTANRVPVQHFALGDTRMTLGTITCGSAEHSFSVTAIQAANKPGQFRCYAAPVRPSSTEDNEDVPAV